MINRNQKIILLLGLFFFTASILLYKRLDQSLVSFQVQFFIALACSAIIFILGLSLLIQQLREKCYDFKKEKNRSFLHLGGLLGMFLLSFSALAWHLNYGEASFFLQPGESLRASRKNSTQSMAEIFLLSQKTEPSALIFKSEKLLTNYEKDAAQLKPEQKQQRRLELEILLANAFQDHIQLLSTMDTNKYFMPAERKFIENNEALFDAILKTFEAIRRNQADAPWLHFYRQVSRLCAGRFYSILPIKKIAKHDPIFSAERLELIHGKDRQIHQLRASTSYTGSTQLTRELGKSFLFYSAKATAIELQTFALINIEAQKKAVQNWNNPYLLAPMTEISLAESYTIKNRGIINKTGKINGDGYIQSGDLDLHKRFQPFPEWQTDLEVSGKLKEEQVIKIAQVMPFVYYKISYQSLNWLIQVVFWSYLLILAVILFYKRET